MAIDDFYVILKSGICIFAKTRHERIDPNAFSGLMTALNTISNELFNSNMTSFFMGKSKYTTIFERGIYFIARTDDEVPDQDIFEQLEQMKNIFFEYTGEAEIKYEHLILNQDPVLIARYKVFFMNPLDKLKAQLW
ncbi:MAG TPA: hypothetical protein VKK79_14700 [Candidatus Lokiarchaeia archaeon]|nr:hypothetical protein [Candidatus Lokiarchaeia archaeon]